MDFVNWMIANQALLLVLMGGIASVLATAKQIFKPSGRKATVLDVMIDLFSWKPALGHTGPWGLPFSIPGIPSIDRAQRAHFLSLKAAQALNAANFDIIKAEKIDLKVFIPIALLCLVSSCATAMGKQIKTDVKSCALDAAPAAVSNLKPAVSAIIVAGASDWMAELGALESVFGPFLVCTVVDVYKDLQMKAPAVPLKGEADSKLIAALHRASTYLGARGVKL